MENQTNEFDEKYVTKIFNELLAFQGYGFCKAHAASYSVYSAVQLWLQEHYFLEYMAVLLTHVDRAKKKGDISMLDERVQYCIEHGATVHYPNINSSNDRWQIKAGGLLAPLSNIKGFSDKDTELIIANRPYSSIRDFADKTNFGKGKFEALLFANALSDFDNVETLYNWYYNEYSKSGKKKKQNDNLFLDFGELFEDKEEDVNHVFFSKQELKEKCLDMNGFFIEENLMINHPDIYSNGMKNYIEDSKLKIYSLQEAIESETKEPWVFVKIKSIDRNIKSKSGSFYDKIILTDGANTISVFSNNSPPEFKENNKIIICLNIDKENEKININRYMEEKYGVFLIEQGE